MNRDPNLKHNPFASLRNVTPSNSAPARATSPVTVQASKALRVVVREELDPVEKTQITRVIGLPRDRLNALGKAWRESLGCTVYLEGNDLLAVTGDSDHVLTLVSEAISAEVTRIRRPEEVDISTLGDPGGTLRSQIRRGIPVAIVLKADQESGALTEGIVQDILTSSPEHPRGIKVRLESGQVGRVRRLLPR